MDLFAGVENTFYFNILPIEESSASCVEKRKGMLPWKIIEMLMGLFLHVW